jgi:DNA-binding XRE family transcriptional regulator
MPSRRDNLARVPEKRQRAQGLRYHGDKIQLSFEEAVRQISSIPAPSKVGRRTAKGIALSKIYNQAYNFLSKAFEKDFEIADARAKALIRENVEALKLYNKFRNKMDAKYNSAPQYNEVEIGDTIDITLEDVSDYYEKLDSTDLEALRKGNKSPTERENMDVQELKSTFANAGNKAEVGQAVKQARIQANLSQSQLSAETGLSIRTISRLETGSGSAPLKTLQQIANATKTKLKIGFE